MKTVLLALFAFSTAAAQDITAFVKANAARFQPRAERFQFALIGDQQYTPLQEKQFENVIDSMNREPLRFVVHDGDIIGSNKPCDDVTFGRRLQTFNRSAHPFILTPGDNDWTDCAKPSMGGFDPLERLATVRRLFLPAPGRTLGKRTIAVLSQGQMREFAPYVENLMWAQGQVLFATLHVVGTNNNAAKPSEYEPRNAANLFWLHAAFAVAREQKFRAVLLVMQANPRFDSKKADGFTDTKAALEEESIAFPGQVILVHGDSHYFRIDKPLVPATNNPEGSRLTNFTRVETFGPPDAHWVRATADPANDMVLSFEQRIVAANKRNHATVK